MFDFPGICLSRRQSKRERTILSRTISYLVTLILLMFPMMELQSAVIGHFPQQIASILWQYQPVQGMFAPGLPRNPKGTLRDRHDEFLSQVIHNDRTQERFLRRVLEDAEDALQRQQYREAAQRISMILTSQEDTFTLLATETDQKLFRSLKHTAWEMVRTSPRELRNAYLDLNQIPAKKLLNEARVTASQRDYQQLFKSYFFTDAGKEAGVYLAKYHYDRGEFSLSAEYASRLLDEPAHRKQLSVGFLLQTALCFRCANRIDDAERLINSLKDQTISIKGKRKTVPQWYDDLQGTFPISQHNHSHLPFALHGWSVQPNIPLSQLVPDSSPLWSRSLRTKKSKLLHPFMDAIKYQREESGHTNTSLMYPQIRKNLLLFRDDGYLHAANVQSGEIEWSFRQKSLEEEMHITLIANPIGSNPIRSRSVQMRMETLHLLNSLQGSFSADEERVYVLGTTYPGNLLLDSNVGGGFFAVPDPIVSDGTEIDDLWNQLIVLPLESETKIPKPLWKLGGSPNQSNMEEKPPFAGHYFLAPPLVINAQLYLVSEYQGSIVLSCLAAETGELFWKQPIANVTEKMDGRSLRFFRAPLLAFSDGVLFCQTQLGTLVAMDTLSGNLLWTTLLFDLGDMSYAFQIEKLVEESVGDLSFLTPPLVVRDKVIVSSRHSEYLRCFHLHTGKVLWRVHRDSLSQSPLSGNRTQQAGEERFLAGVFEETLLVVGNSRCRGLDLNSGRERWSIAVPPSSGQGTFLGKHYLLPLTNGSVLILDPKTGVMLNFNTPDEQVDGPNGPMLSPNWGHLIAIPRPDAQENEPVARFVSVTSDSVSVWTSLEHRLQVLNKMRNPHQDHFAEWLEQIDLKFSAGMTEGLREMLREGLNKSHSPADREAIRKRLLNVIFWEWTHPELAEISRKELLTLWKETAQTDQEHLILLQHEGEFLADLGDLNSAKVWGERFSQLTSNELLITFSTDQHSSVHPEYWKGFLYQKTWNNATPEMRARFLSLLKPMVSRWEQTLTTPRNHEHSGAENQWVSVNSEEIERFLREWYFTPLATSLRLAYGQFLIDAGRFHKAEMLLLQNRNATDPSIATQSRNELFQLWTDRGFHRDADKLFQSSSQFPSLSKQHNPAEASPLRQVASQRVSAKEELQAVSTQSQIKMGFFYDSSTRTNRTSKAWKILKSEYHGGISYQFDSTTKNESDTPTYRLQLKSQQTGQIHQRVLLPCDPRVWINRHTPLPGRIDHLGHFFPISDGNSLSGISCLEPSDHNLVWTLPVDFTVQNQQRVSSRTSFSMYPCFSNPTVTIFQSLSSMIAVDTATGQLLWKKTGLHTLEGILSSHLSDMGVMGNDEVVVVFQRDVNTWIKYDSRTGIEIERGSLPLDFLTAKKISQRHLMYFERSLDSTVFHLWDSVRSKDVLSFPISEKPLHTVTAEGELALVFPSGRFLLIRPADGTIVFDKQIQNRAGKNLRLIRVFRIQNRLFVNLQGGSDQPDSQKRFVERASSQCQLDHLDLLGYLIAIDLETQTELWIRLIAPTRLLTTVSESINGLVFVSYVAYVADSSGKMQRVQEMRTKVMDPQTGSTLAVGERIPMDLVDSAAIDIEHQQVILGGKQSRITIKWKTERQFDLESVQ